MAKEPMKKKSVAQPKKAVVKTVGNSNIVSNAKSPKNYKPLSTGEKVMMATSFVPGSAVGSVVGKLATKAGAKKIGQAVLKAGTSKNPAKIARPKPELGKTVKTAPGRSTQVKGSTGNTIVKPQGPNPSVRAIKRSTSLEKVDQGVRSGNKLRYATAKKNAQTAREAYVKTSSKPTVGKVAGGASSTAATVNAKKKKK